MVPGPSLSDEEGDLGKKSANFLIMDIYLQNYGKDTFLSLWQPIMCYFVIVELANPHRNN